MQGSGASERCQHDWTGARDLVLLASGILIFSYGARFLLFGVRWGVNSTLAGVDLLLRPLEPSKQWVPCPAWDRRECHLQYCHAHKVWQNSMLQDFLPQTLPCYVTTMRALMVSGFAGYGKAVFENALLHSHPLFQHLRPAASRLPICPPALQCARWCILASSGWHIIC